MPAIREVSPSETGTSKPVHTVPPRRFWATSGRATRALEQAMGNMTTTGWSGACLAMGRAQPVHELPLNRWREAEVHLSDVGLSSFTIDQWSDDLVRHDLAFAAAQRDAELPEPIARRSPRRQLAWVHGRYGPNDAAWDATTLRSGWRRPFTTDEVAAIEAAAIDPEIRPVPRPVVLPALERLVDELRQHLVEGQGVAAFEGFPVERFDPTQLRAIWWGVSCALGTPVSQSWRGDLIGDVRDLGTGISGPVGRGYTSNSELNFHADACDISGLFFLRTAKDGGVTRVASAVAAHDVMARRRPDALDLLYQPLPWSWQGNQSAGEPGWYEMPVFGLVDDRVSCAYVRTNILLAPQNAGAPALSAEQVEAVQMLVETASEPGLWVEHSFEPGAMVFVHNHTALHLRTAFTDWDDPARKRHLLRVWISTPNSRQLPESFGSFFSSLDAGTVRGGYAPNPSAAANAANTDTATRASTS